MNIKIAQAILAASEERDLSLRLYENYSGRGMDGNTTAGIIGDRGEFLHAVAVAAAEMGCHRDPASNDFFSVQDIRTDNLGRSYIMY
jgi:hypothetical protein